MGHGAQHAGRPRQSRVDEAITSATRQLLAEVGYGGLTMDAVAGRAGIGKAAIYRRYASKQEMVFAAAVRGHPLTAPPDSGSLRGDLIALAQMIVGSLGGPVAANAVISLLADAASDPALSERLGGAVVGPQRAVITELLERAVCRGELDQVPDVDLLHSVFGGTALLWMFMVRRAPHELPERLARLACAAFPAGALRASGDARLEQGIDDAEHM